MSSRLQLELTALTIVISGYSRTGFVNQRHNFTRGQVVQALQAIRDQEQDQRLPGSVGVPTVTKHRRRS